ncbi:MAG: hypothetical protein JSS75_13005 [Bacteroidetes bacterium]|nr:hypothetical protein [Bacteroidota bacterium]
MRKVLMLIALGSFMATAVTSYACDGDKACAMKGKKASSSCCAAKGTKAAATKADPNCKVKNGKDCSKDPNCVKEMAGKKSTKNCCAKDANKKS